MERNGKYVYEMNYNKIIEIKITIIQKNKRITGRAETSEDCWEPIIWREDRREPITKRDSREPVTWREEISRKKSLEEKKLENKQFKEKIKKLIRWRAEI